MSASGPTTIVFRVVAHPDDWLLFGGEQAEEDLRSASAKVVLIHMSAGDAGEARGWWEARERGSVAAAACAAGAPRPEDVTEDVVVHNGHPVARVRCAGNALYFLRLPDGNPEGTGYPATGHRSLPALRDSGAPLAAVDGSTTYASWRDLCDTVAALLAHERDGIAEEHPWIHAPDPTPETNPDDHPDHTATGDVVRAVAQGVYSITWWATYCTADRPANLDGEALERKQRLFQACEDEIARVAERSGTPVPPAEGEWSRWGDRSYARRVAWDGSDVVFEKARPSGE